MNQYYQIDIFLNHKEKIDEINKSTIFTEYNLDTTEYENNQNLSKSDILAPFNSTNSESSGNSAMKFRNIQPKKIIKLHPKLREIDRNYEKNNN